jgi:hydrogenase small subunit
VSFPIGSGHGCLGCSEPDFWDNGPFYERLETFPKFGAETNATRIGATAAAVVGVGIAAHAGLTALRQAKVKPNSPAESEKRQG